MARLGPLARLRIGLRNLGNTVARALAAPGRVAWRVSPDSSREYSRNFAGMLAGRGGSFGDSGSARAAALVAKLRGGRENVPTGARAGLTGLRAQIGGNGH